VVERGEHLDNLLAPRLHRQRALGRRRQKVEQLGLRAVLAGLAALVLALYLRAIVRASS
jgi:hypothetical protein